MLLLLQAVPYSRGSLVLAVLRGEERRGEERRREERRGEELRGDEMRGEERRVWGLKLARGGRGSKGRRRKDTFKKLHVMVRVRKFNGRSVMML